MSLSSTSRAFPKINNLFVPSISAWPDYTRESLFASFLLLYPLRPFSFILLSSRSHSLAITFTSPGELISSSNSYSSFVPGTFSEISVMSWILLSSNFFRLGNDSVQNYWYFSIVPKGFPDKYKSCIDWHSFNPLHFSSDEILLSEMQNFVSYYVYWSP